MESTKKRKCSRARLPSNPNITGKRGPRTQLKRKKSARATDTTGAGNQPEICLGEKDEMNVDENKDATREIKRKKECLRGGWFYLRAF